MEHLSKRKTRKICKLLMKQNEEEKKLKKYKVANGNVKKYNEVAQLKIKEKKRNKKLDEIKEKMEMFVTIKRMEVSVNDEEHELKYDCEENEDEDDKDKRVERFRCDYEGCKNSYKHKEEFSQHFKSHFTGELTCKQCNATFTLKDDLKRHLLLHENKSQFKCPHESCDKIFDTKGDLDQHKVVHLESECNDCSFKTNYCSNLNEHIKTKHTSQGLVKCKWPGCHKEFTKKYLYNHMKTHRKSNHFKCTFDGCDYVTNIHGYEQRYLKAHIKRVHLKKK